MGEFVGFEVWWTWARILSFSFLNCLMGGNDMLSLRVIKALSIGVGTERHSERWSLLAPYFSIFQLTSGWASLYWQSEKQLLVLIPALGRKTTSPVGNRFLVFSWPGHPWSMKLPFQVCWSVARGNSRTKGHLGYRCNGGWQGHSSRSLKSSPWGAGGVTFSLQWESRKANSIWELEAAKKTLY